MHHYKISQANYILERIHSVAGSIIKTKYLDNTTFDAVTLWSNIIASILYEVQCSYHSMLHSTPGKVVFGHDMLLDINFLQNYKEIWLRKKKLSVKIIRVITKIECNTTTRSDTTRTSQRI